MANYSRDDLIALARREAQRAGLPQEIVPTFLGLVQQESGWNPRAVSSAGAQGLGQLMPDTARGLGVTDVFDPVQNLSGAARYLKQQLDRFGDIGLALAAYNWGPGRVRKLVDDPRSVRIPKETMDYVPKVLGHASRFGSQIAPSTATLAFFPKSGDVIKQTVDAGVTLRTGAGGAADVDARLRMGKAPSGKDLGAPPAAPPIAGEVPIGEQVPGVGFPMAGELPTMAQVTSNKAVQNVRSLDEYLKQQFGPVAAVADPFPKGYDQKLMRLIEQA
jgi:hypothetical protein